MSFRTRLSLFSALSVLGVFLLVAMLLYAIFFQRSNAALDSDLRRQKSALSRSGSQLAEGGGGQRLRERLRGQRNLPLRIAKRTLLAQVVNRDGTVVLSSDPLQELGSLPVDSTTSEVASSGREQFRNVQVGDTPLRLYESVMGRGTVLQLALERGEADRALATLRRVLALLAIVAALLGALVGRWLAGRALTPVEQMTDTARSIERTGDLSQRVLGDDEPDELGALALTFNEMLGSIEQLQQGQRRFVADASHELRTPITSLSGNLEFLARVGMSDDARREAWEDVRGDMGRLTALANDLVLLARADAGTGAATFAPVDLGALTRDITDNLGRQHDAHTLHCDVAPLTVSGDGTALERVVSNLVSNALRYTPPGSTVDVRLREAAGWAELTVADDGPGMSPDDAAHIFDRFRRGTTSQGTDGSGLGLAIVRQTAHAHRGAVHLDTAPDQGCRFTVRLPLAGQPAMPQ